MNNSEELWKKALGKLELEISKANFVTWFKNTSIADIAKDKVFVAVPSGFVKEWLEYKYHKPIIKVLRSVIPSTRSVEFVVSTQPQIKTLHQASSVSEHEAPDKQPEFHDLYVDRETSLNPRYTFNDFVVGSFNELAHAAAQAVIKTPGKLYNPLFIYGGVGLGKTHLLQAIGNTIRNNEPKTKVNYTTTEKLSNDYVTSVQNNEIQSFKEKFRAYDLFILDDIQFISGKIKTQEEVFHIFNSLYEKGKQIVFSSDCPPKSIQNLEERLRSRFEGGMIVDISEPEFEARLAILKSKLKIKQTTLSEKILEHIANEVQNNIRELEGALNSILARTKLQGKELSLDAVKDILDKNKKPRKTITSQQIIKTVASFYNVQEKSLYEKTRKKEIVKPRQIAMYLLREDYNGSYPYIGQKFGGRDHTTAIHAYEKIVRDLKQDDRLTDEIKNIRDILYVAD